MNYTITIPKPPSKASKDEEKAPAGSWLQHMDKDKKNNGILWRNNHTEARSYYLYYLPWDTPSAPGDENKYLIESPFVEMTGEPKKVPLGSWLQHKRDDGHLCWRNNHTNEYARRIWFSRDEVASSLSSPAPRILVEARLVATLKEPSPKDKPKGPVQPPAPPGKKKKGPTAPPSVNIILRGHPWEELIHEVCGTKHWRHRDTGEIRLNDPFR